MMHDDKTVNVWLNPLKSLSNELFSYASFNCHTVQTIVNYNYSLKKKEIC